MKVQYYCQGRQGKCNRCYALRFPKSNRGGCTARLPANGRSHGIKAGCLQKVAQQQKSGNMHDALAGTCLSSKGFVREMIAVLCPEGVEALGCLQASMNSHPLPTCESPSGAMLCTAVPGDLQSLLGGSIPAWEIRALHPAEAEPFGGCQITWHLLGVGLAAG